MNQGYIKSLNGSLLVLDLMSSKLGLGLGLDAGR